MLEPFALGFIDKVLYEIYVCCLLVSFACALMSTDLKFRSSDSRDHSESNGKFYHIPLSGTLKNSRLSVCIDSSRFFCPKFPNCLVFSPPWSFSFAFAVIAVRIGASAEPFYVLVGQ